MTIAELWAIAGLLLCVAELLAPGVFLLWIGLAALCTGAVTALASFGWHVQIAIFIAFALVLIALAARRTRRWPGRDLVNAPNAGLVGATCTAIDFRDREGRVHFRDSTWSARIEGDATPVPGSTLRVIGLDGTTLLVRTMPP